MAMHVSESPDSPANRNRAERIRRIFRLRDVDQVKADWSIDQYTSKSAMVEIGLVEHISAEEANALRNGAPPVDRHVPGRIRRVSSRRPAWARRRRLIDAKYPQKWVEDQRLTEARPRLIATPRPVNVMTGAPRRGGN